MKDQIALLGGVYSNYLALNAALDDIDARGIEHVFCLGDLGAFGPHPDKTVDILRENRVVTLQGNYDNSIAFGLDDCQCGYTDPRDNYYAKLSYDYTLNNTSEHHRRWMRTLPQQLRIKLAGKDVLLCHGSPRQLNEFMWESTTPTHFLEKMCVDFAADVIACTHTGLHWHRALPSGRHFINAGVLGRPANDGTTNVWYTVLSHDDDGVDVEFVPVYYDYAKLAAEMESEGLPHEFVRTICEGWWTTCLEVLPAKERARGRF